MYKFELVRNYDEVNGFKLSAKIIPENEIERDILEKSIKKFEEEFGMRERILEVTISDKVKMLEAEKVKVNKELDYMEKIKGILEFIKSEENKKYFKFDLNYSKVIENLDFQGAEYTFKEIRREMELLREINVDSAIRRANKKEEKELDLSIINKDEKQENGYPKKYRAAIERLKENAKDKDYIIKIYTKGKNGEINSSDVYFKNRSIYNGVCSCIESLIYKNKSINLHEYLLKYSYKYDKEFIKYAEDNKIKVFIDMNTVRKTGLEV